MTDFPQFFYAVVLFVVVPLLAWSSRLRMTPDIILPRIPVYVEVTVIQIILLGASLALARRQKIELFPSSVVDVRAALAAAALLGVALIAFLIASRGETLRENFVLRIIAPESRLEKFLWVPVCIAAGIGEEVAYRGVLPQILEGTGKLSTPAVIAACAIAFGMAHLLQGWTAAAVTAVFGLGFHLLVMYSGNLYGAIAVHFAYDLIAGYMIARWMEKEEL